MRALADWPGEAIASLENAIRLCRAVTEDPQPLRREQGLYLQLGQALIASQGYQAAATLRAFARALELADAATTSRSSYRPCSPWAGHHIAGTGSSALADRYAGLAEAQPDTGPRLVGLRMLGLENAAVQGQLCRTRSTCRIDG